MNEPKLTGETLIAQLVRSTTDEAEDLKRKAHEAGGMAYRLKCCGLPFQQLVHLWTGDHSNPMLRAHFWRGVDQA